jgi:hypothetical protein
VGYPDEGLLDLGCGENIEKREKCQQESYDKNNKRSRYF